MPIKTLTEHSVWSLITPRLAIEVFYVILVGTLATLGLAPSGYSARPILALAGFVSLPCGVAALVSVYVLTGIFNSHPGGGAHGFFFDASVISCFVIAAVANLVVLRSIAAAKSDRTARVFASKSLVGLTLDSALRRAQESGVREVRSIEVRGGMQVQPVLMDFRPYRLNLWIEDRTVVQAKFDGEDRWQDSGGIAPVQ